MVRGSSRPERHIEWHKYAAYSGTKTTGVLVSDTYWHAILRFFRGWCGRATSENQMYALFSKLQVHLMRYFATLGQWCCHNFWISVGGLGLIPELGSCAFDLGFGIGGGGVSTYSGLSQEIIKLLVAKINKIFLFLPVIPVMAIVHMKIQLNKIWLFHGLRAVAKETILIGQPTK